MEDQLKHKILVGLERISEAFKALLWEKAKVHGISPIQIQILLFISNHAPELCTISHLAKEFNVTKPTVSDAIRILYKKELVEKTRSTTDSRSYTIFPSPKGKTLLQDLETYALPFQNELDRLEDSDLQTLYSSLTQLIFQLNRAGILTVQRTCYGCKFYEKTSDAHYCHLLKQRLVDRDIRLDCPEYEARE